MARQRQRKATQILGGSAVAEFRDDVLVEVTELLGAEDAESAPEEQVPEEASETPATPEPTATGNERITILHHNMAEAGRDDRGDRLPTGAQLSIGNVSDSTVATAVFEAEFYDEKGNVIGRTTRREVDLRPDTSRRILMQYEGHQYHHVKSYRVWLSRTTTADTEKVQLRRREIGSTETGELELTGTVKNISDVKTDAALVAIFYDLSGENIGTKVLVLRDIEPGTITQYAIKFRPQEGETLGSHTLVVGDIVG